MGEPDRAKLRQPADSATTSLCRASVRSARIVSRNTRAILVRPASSGRPVTSMAASGTRISEQIAPRPRRTSLLCCRNSYRRCSWNRRRVDHCVDADAVQAVREKQFRCDGDDLFAPVGVSCRRFRPRSERASRVFRSTAIALAASAVSRRFADSGFRSAAAAVASSAKRSASIVDEPAIADLVGDRRR